MSRPESAVPVTFRTSLSTTDRYFAWMTQIPAVGSTVAYPDRIEGRRVVARVLAHHWLLDGNPVIEPVTNVDVIVQVLSPGLQK